jgi:hypothetical protein
MLELHFSALSPAGPRGDYAHNEPIFMTTKAKDTIMLNKCL